MFEHGGIEDFVVVGDLFDKTNFNKAKEQLDNGELLLFNW